MNNIGPEGLDASILQRRHLLGNCKKSGALRYLQQIVISRRQVWRAKYFFMRRRTDVQSQSGSIPGNDS